MRVDFFRDLSMLDELGLGHEQEREHRGSGGACPCGKSRPERHITLHRRTGLATEAPGRPRAPCWAHVIIATASTWRSTRRSSQHRLHRLLHPDGHDQRAPRRARRDHDIEFRRARRGGRDPSREPEVDDCLSVPPPQGAEDLQTLGVPADGPRRWLLDGRALADMHPVKILSTRFPPTAIRWLAPGAGCLRSAGPSAET